MGLKHGNGRKARRNERRLIEHEIYAYFNRWPIRPRKPPPSDDSPARRTPNPQEVSRNR